MGRYSPGRAGPGRCVVLADAEFSETSSHRMRDGLIDTSRLWLVPAHNLMKSTEKNTYCPEICKIFAYMLDKIRRYVITYLEDIIHILLQMNHIIHMLMIKRII